MAPTPLRAVIAGGGVAALEAAAAVEDLAGDRAEVTLIAPDREFVYRPLMPQRALRGETPPRVPLADLAARAGATLVTDRLGWVDRSRMRAHPRTGAPIPYDALILCPGAVSAPRFAHAATIDGRASTALHEVFDAIRDGWLRDLVLVAPAGSGWPLPLYEVALMSSGLTAHREPERRCHIVIVTSEHAPLGIFGDAAAQQMAGLLDERGIDLITHAQCDVPDPRHVSFRGPDGTEHTLSADRVLALPQLVGPHVRGIPSSDNGFIPIDRHCAVRGTERIYAAGDATDYPVKHGGLAAQQAVVAATAIARLAGAPVAARTFRPTLEAVLLTGGQPRYLTARLAGAEPFGSQMRAGAQTGATTKIVAPYLTELLSGERH